MGKLGAILSFLRTGDENRRAGRLPIDASLNCNLGVVRDCSGSGLRVQSHRRVRGPIVLVRLWDDRGGLECEARVIWSARKGFFHHEAGLLLPPLDDRDRTQLARLATSHRDRRLLSDRKVA